MNTPNNSRRRRSRESLIQALIQLLQTKALKEIRVQEVCCLAGVNRTTFYASFSDIYALADAAEEKLEREVEAIYYRNGDAADRMEVFLRLFRHVYDNQLLYKTFFKLGGGRTNGLTEEDERFAVEYYGGVDIDYHIAFFRAGLNAVIEKWLSEGCRKTPEEICAVIASEYFTKRV